MKRCMRFGSGLVVFAVWFLTLANVALADTEELRAIQTAIKAKGALYVFRSPGNLIEVNCFLVHWLASSLFIKYSSFADHSTVRQFAAAIVQAAGLWFSGHFVVRSCWAWLIFVLIAYY